MVILENNDITKEKGNYQHYPSSISWRANGVTEFYYKKKYKY
jgi:hypothetical protein